MDGDYLSYRSGSSHDLVYLACGDGAMIKDRDDVNTAEESKAFWQGIIYNEDGTLNEDKVLAELHDYLNCIGFAAVVYCHATGDKISKINTLPSVVMSVIDDHISEIVEEEIADREHAVA